MFRGRHSRIGCRCRRLANEQHKPALLTLEQSKASAVEPRLLKSQELLMSIGPLSKAAEPHEQTAEFTGIAAKRPRMKCKVKYIASPADVPAGQNYVLVEYGVESGQKRHALGFTITVARNQSTSDLAFLPQCSFSQGPRQAGEHFPQYLPAKCNAYDFGSLDLGLWNSQPK